MLQLTRDSAPYSELDFPQFNPRGFIRVRQAVEVAQQRRNLAQSAEELREATNALRLANDIKNAEQHVAQKNFEVEREKAFTALDDIVRRFAKTHLPKPKSLEIENQLDHLITLFNLKDFSKVLREVGNVLQRIKGRPARPNPDRYTSPRPFRPRPETQSISSLYKRGLALECANRRREAIEVYGQVVQRNPRHWQAITRLRELGKVAEFNLQNKQRRPSWTRKHRRYAG
jgi:tetratricopeptide (TPR) repeat protein